MTDEEAKSEYYKNHVGDPRDFGSKAVLLREAIANARKNAGRVAGFRRMKKKQLYAIVRNQESN